MKLKRIGEQGFLSMSIIETVVVAGMAVYLMSWVLHPIRSSQSVRTYVTLEMMQRDYYQRLNPVIEDIREATGNTMLWDNLDPAKAGYNPKNFPWFVVQDPSLSGAKSYICYYFDDNDRSFWRVKTSAPPNMADPCSSSVLGASAKSVASGLSVPTTANPLFRGDVKSSTVYFSLRAPLSASPAPQGGGLPQMLEVIRMGAVRN